MTTLISGQICPRSGDLALVRVDVLGQHRRVELPDGRKALLWPGDELIVCMGNRYAPDQFEAVMATDLSPCDLVAAGGIASVELTRHDRMHRATGITPLGLIAGGDGERLNVFDYRIHQQSELPALPIVLSLGTSMNAGKTLTATSLVRGFKKAGLKVAALKITGTGAGGDTWIVRDAGADLVLDFTDAGFATTYLAPIKDIEEGAGRLLNHAANLGCDIAVIEIADGLQQKETAALIRSQALRESSIGVVFASYDAMGAKSGIDDLRALGHTVLAISGRVCRSPLGFREAAIATKVPIHTPADLQAGSLLPIIKAVAARKLKRNGDDGYLRRVAEIGDFAGSGFKRGARQSPEPRPAIDATQILALIAERAMQVEADLLCQSHHEHVARPARRAGFREMTWTTDLGNVSLRVPRVHPGAYHPSFMSVNRIGANVIDAILRHTAPEDVAILVAQISSQMQVSLSPLQIRAIAADLSPLIADSSRDPTHQSSSVSSDANWPLRADDILESGLAEPPDFANSNDPDDPLPIDWAGAGVEAEDLAW
jgi:hypothetical protein